MIEFHTKPIAEARGVQRWYADRSRQAGERFHAQMGKTIVRVESTPRQFAISTGPFRYALIFGFPYVVVFRLKEDETPFVIAIAHTSRRTGYWRSRE